MGYDKEGILRELREKAGEYRLSTPDSLEFRALKGEWWRIPPPSSVWFECTQESAEKILEDGWGEGTVRCYPSPNVILGYRSFSYQSKIVRLRIPLESLTLVNLYEIPYTPGEWSTPQERTGWEMGNFPDGVDGWYRPDEVVVLRSEVAWRNCDKVIHGSKKKG